MADEEEMSGGDEGGEGGGGKKKLIMIIVVLLVVIGAAVGAMMFLGGDEEEGGTSAETEASQLEAEMEAKSQDEEVKLTNPRFSPPKSYTVNLRDGKHFLNIQLSAAVEDENALFFLAGREYIIDDMIITMLQDLTTENLRTRAGVEILKRELYKKINGLFTQEFIDASETKDRKPVKKILITKFVLN